MTDLSWPSSRVVWVLAKTDFCLVGGLSVILRIKIVESIDAGSINHIDPVAICSVIPTE